MPEAARQRSTGPAARIPATWLAVTWFVAAAGVLLSGCSRLAPHPGEEAEIETEEVLRVYAAAAREYERRNGRWPTEETELLSVMSHRPPTAHVSVEFLRFESSTDGTLEVRYESPLTDAGDGADDRLRGTLEVRPVGVEDRPDAELTWRYGGPLLATSGRVALEECALGEFEKAPAGSSSAVDASSASRDPDRAVVAAATLLSRKRPW